MNQQELIKTNKVIKQIESENRTMHLEYSVLKIYLNSLKEDD